MWKTAVAKNYGRNWQAYFTNATRFVDVAASVSEEDIKRAYKKRSLKLHPDKNPPENREMATAAFKQLGK
jgi:DnaJ-class molecular chaperone